MNEFKDRQVALARAYLFAAPVILICVYILSITASFTAGNYSISTEIADGFLNNAAGSLALGYGAACEATIIYIFIQLFRKSRSSLKVLLCILLIPAMIICVFPALVAAIPYYIYSYIKTKRIASDSLPVFSKGRLSALACLFAAAVTVTAVLAVMF